MSRSSSVSIEGISSKNKIRIANNKNESRVANSRNPPKKLPLKSKSIASKSKAPNLKAPVAPVKVIFLLYSIIFKEYYDFKKYIIQYRVSQIEIILFS